MAERAMHRPARGPSCWAVETKPLCDWSFDRGRSCGSMQIEPRHRGAAQAPLLAGAVRSEALWHTPGCAGCARGQRAHDIACGLVEPEPHMPSRIAS